MKPKACSLKRFIKLRTPTRVTKNKTEKTKIGSKKINITTYPMDMKETIKEHGE